MERNGKRVTGRGGASFRGVGTPRRVPGGEKGKDKTEDPGWGEIRTLPNGHKEGES